MSHIPKAIAATLIFLGFMGCGESSDDDSSPKNPIYSCATADHDCCSEDWHCEEVFDAPQFCLNGENGEGTCGACRNDDDCSDGLVCSEGPRTVCF